MLEIKFVYRIVILLPFYIIRNISSNTWHKYFINTKNLRIM